MNKANKTDIKVNKKYCSFCDNTGIITNPYYLELGDEPLSPCPKCVLVNCSCNGNSPYYCYTNNSINECSCREIRLKIERINSIYSRSGIDKKYRWKFINNFESTNKKVEEAKSIAYDIITKFPDVKKGLFLWGNPGSGKTMLSAIILTELITRHAINGSLIKISRNFFNRLRSSFVEGSPNYGEATNIEREYAEIDILVVDDFGVQRDSPWEQETLYNLIDARYEAEKFTVFTSNNDPYKTLKEKADGRILSRLKEMCRIIEISGDDYREKL
ncbi:MAG: ATP-binding protein [Spirochaetota bacterium]|nr:ATP-binding protein [Spirochaetota bacterium]